MKRMLYVGVVVLLLPFLGGCGKALRYQAKCLNHLTVASAGSYDEKNNVTVLLQRFDSRMNEYYFNKSNLKYTAYQLTINNQSDEEWALQLANLGVPTVDFEAIQQNITPSFGRSFGMYLIPMAGVNLIAGTVYLCQQTKTKDRIISDLGDKVFQSSVTVAPHSKVSTIFFVDGNIARARLNVTLNNATNYKKQETFILSMR